MAAILNPPEQRDANRAAKARLLSLPGEPLFIANWERVLMVHYEVDPQQLQAVVPIELDLREGRAYVSLVAFTMRGMRPRFGGRLAAWMLKPIATHNFLNVRTYVRHRNETGIFFMTEWLSNRLSVALGLAAFGLPYKHGRIRYAYGSCEGQPHREQQLTGRVEESIGREVLSYSAKLDENAAFTGCESESLDEWLMERYTAFTGRNRKARFFRVWHEPWRRTNIRVRILEGGLIASSWPFMADARVVGATYSPGAFGVWMGRPHRLPLADSKSGRREARGQSAPDF
jgi:uncharacterized protein YqjF (DUF2071 family)